MTDDRRAARSRPRAGLSAAQRALWARMYEETPFRELPWFSADPFPALVRAVESGWFRPPGPVLDVGCGAGSNVLWLVEHGFRATGVDIAPGAIAAAESRRTPSTRSARFLVDDMLASQLSPRSFRGAVDAGCFHTLAPRQRVEYARSLARTLRPDAPYLLSWVAREETGSWGPPHRLSVKDVVDVFESDFRVDQLEYRPRVRRSPRPARGSLRPLVTLAGYTARFIRRRGPQPPPR